MYESRDGAIVQRATGVEEVHALKRGLAPNGVYFLYQQFGVVPHPGPRMPEDRFRRFARRRKVEDPLDDAPRSSEDRLPA